MRVVDMHCDTISELAEKRKRGRNLGLRQNELHVDLVRMKKSGYILQNFALFVHCGKCSNPWEEVCTLFDIYHGEMEHNRDLIAPVLQYQDIRANEAEGKLSALLTVEEGAVCQGQLEKLHQLYHMGVRMMTLTWNYPNELGYPNATDGRDRGLKDRGKIFVEEMQHMGMIVDVSHLSDAGFYDVWERASKPFVASHSNAREICSSPRNLSDEMIRRLSQKGGCMGLNFYADFLENVRPGKNNPGIIEAVVRHAKHIVKVGGIEVLGLGTDYDGMDTPKELPGVQSMEHLWDAMHQQGFTAQQLDQIFEKNVLRVYGDIL